jgi:hypothetical protein
MLKHQMTDAVSEYFQICNDCDRARVLVQQNQTASAACSSAITDDTRPLVPEKPPPGYWDKESDNKF